MGIKLKYKNLLNILTINNLILTMNLVVSLYIIKSLNPSIVGDFFYISLINLLTTIYFTGPFNWLYLSDVADKNHERVKNVALMYTYVNMIFIIMGICHFYFTKNINGLTYSTLTLVQVLYIYVSIYQADYENEMKYVAISLYSGIASIFGSCAALVVLNYTENYAPLLIRELIPPIILILIYAYLSKGKIKWKFKCKRDDVLLRIMVSYSFLGILEKIFFKAPFMIIGLKIDKINLGNIIQAYNYALLPNTLLSSITERLSFGLISNNKYKKEDLYKILLIIIFTVLPTIVLLNTIGQQLLINFFGDKWETMIKILKDFSIFIVLLPIFSFLKTICLVTSKGIVVKCYLLGILLIFTIVLGLIFLELDTSFIAFGYGFTLIIMLIYVSITCWSKFRTL